MPSNLEMWTMSSNRSNVVSNSDHAQLRINTLDWFSWSSVDKNVVFINYAKWQKFGGPFNRPRLLEQRFIDLLLLFKVGFTNFYGMKVYRTNYYRSHYYRKPCFGIFIKVHKSVKFYPMTFLSKVMIFIARPDIAYIIAYLT